MKILPNPVSYATPTLVAASTQSATIPNKPTIYTAGPIIRDSSLVKPTLIKAEPMVVKTTESPKTIIKESVLNQKKQAISGVTIGTQLGVGISAPLSILGAGAVGAVPIIGLLDGAGAWASLVSAATLADPLKASLLIAGAAVTVLGLGSLIYLGVDHALVQKAKNDVLKDPDLPNEKKEALIRFFAELKTLAKILKNTSTIKDRPSDSIKDNTSLVNLEKKTTALKEELEKKTKKELIKKLDRARTNFKIALYRLLHNPKKLKAIDLTLLNAVLGEDYVAKKTGNHKK